MIIKTGDAQIMAVLNDDEETETLDHETKVAMEKAKATLGSKLLINEDSENN